MSNALFRVTATQLNFRSRPAATASSRIATLAQGDVVEKIAAAAEPDWWQVAAKVQTQRVEGFVAHRFLEPASAPPLPAVSGGIVAVHMEEGKADVRRDGTSGRAFPIGEAGRPPALAGAAAARARGLRAIIDWLDVEQGSRWQPTSSATYCNIYAYDVCFLAGIFLPRVWWKADALRRLDQGEAVTPRYDVTIHELNANALCDWLDDHGPRFGWRRTLDLGEVQDAANAGRLATICAQRVDLNRSGHITIVVPEQGGETAARSGGNVLRPLQSQAGSRNFRYDTGGTAWWTHERFRKFGFWVNDR